MDSEIGEQLKECHDDILNTIVCLQERLKNLDDAWKENDYESLYNMGFISQRQYDELMKLKNENV